MRVGQDVLFVGKLEKISGSVEGIRAMVPSQRSEFPLCRRQIEMLQRRSRTPKHRSSQSWFCGRASTRVGSSLVGSSRR